jgi:hypothetical protein
MSDDRTPSYHDLHLTTPTLPRTSLFNLPFDIEVSCTRAGGWEVWRSKQCIGGEYHGPDKWLLLDVGGHVICDTRPQLDPRVAAVHRIKRGLRAAADRAAGIDTRLMRPLVAGLDALQAQLAVHHSLSLRVIEQILDDAEPMLDLFARVRTLVDAAKDGSAMAWLDAFAGIRDVLYPDTDIARRLNERRSMTPEERAAEREAANAAEREAWAGIVDTPDDHVTSESSLVELPGYVACAGCQQPVAAGEASQLRPAGIQGAFEPGVFCPGCVDLYRRGELVRPT